MCVCVLDCKIHKHTLMNASMGLFLYRSKHERRNTNTIIIKRDILYKMCIHARPAIIKQTVYNFATFAANSDDICNSGSIEAIQANYINGALLLPIM